MKYRAFGNTGLKLSALGFGAMRLPYDDKDGRHVVRVDESIRTIHRAFELGVNYVDTGYGYCYDQSEPVLGKALAGWSGTVYVSDKSPVWLIKRPADYRRYLDLQLKKMQLDSFDIYYFHGISWEAYEQKVRGLGLIDEARRAKAEGLIRHIAFSCHAKPDEAKRMIDDGWAEAILCQYNLLDRSNEEPMTHARQRGLATVVMGPVGGGMLGGPSPAFRNLIPGPVQSTAEFALRFVLGNPDVCCALSGMSSVKMVEENVEIASRDSLLGPDELERIKAAMTESKKFADLYCTGCDYCMPCPSGVNVPRNFALMNLHRIYALTDSAISGYAGMKPETRADQCTECGECEPKCPQKIAIRDQLKEVAATLGTSS